MSNHKVHERPKFDLQKFVTLLQALNLGTGIGLKGTDHEIFANNAQNDPSFRRYLNPKSISKEVPQIHSINPIRFGSLETSSS